MQSPFFKVFTSHLNDFAQKERALFEKKYMKSDRKHLGISHGNMQKAINAQAKILNESELLELAQSLWDSNIYDYMIAATKILKHRKIQKNKSLWKKGKQWLKQCDGWALADGLSLSMREILVAFPDLLKEVEKWTKSSYLWTKRAALVFTLPYAKPDRDPSKMLKWMGEYAADQEWFIQKAIGWWLRDLGSHNPDQVIDFLTDHWDELKSVAKKEATRKLPKKYLKSLPL